MRYSLLFVILASLGFNLSAELLIFKEEKGSLVPLAEDDITKHGEAIASILLKYEWPMCNAFLLNDIDVAALLSPGVPYAQEQFIQRKLNEKFEHLRVVYIPDALFELFCIIQTCATKGQKNPLQDMVVKIMTAKWGSEMHRRWRIDITKLINHNVTDFKQLAEVRNQINKVYKDINDSMYMGKHSVFFYINSLLTTKLLALYHDLHKSKDSLAASAIIEKHVAQFTSVLINELLALYDPNKPENLRLPGTTGVGHDEDRDSIIDLARSLKNEKDSLLVTKVIALEYEARKMNKALLFRGTTFEEFPVGLALPQQTPGGQVAIQAKQKTLAGTSMAKREERIVPKGHRMSLEEAYWLKRNEPYSISFGNSLFAGILRDEHASVYYYLAEKNKPTFKAVGYALLVDKKEYYVYSNNNLFFIPPLSTLAALFERGEYFHARTKAAIAKKNSKEHEIRGLIGFKLKDPVGIILITRDPLRHAEIFSKFIAENSVILQLGNEADLTP